MAAGELAVPVPARTDVCGLPVALSLTLRVAARAPAAVGLNVTLIVQLLPEERLDPQLVVFEKSPVFVPEIEIDICLKLELPELLRVIDCEALLVPTTWSANVRLDGDRFATGPVPLPVSDTACGLSVASSITVKVAALVPTAAGLKVTLTVQLAPAARLDPQVLVWAKSLGSVPRMLMLVNDRVALPVFLRVTDWAELVDPINWLLNGRLEGEIEIEADVPVPDRVTDWGLPVALSAIATEADRLPLAFGVNVTLMVQLEFAASELPQLLL